MFSSLTNRGEKIVYPNQPAFYTGSVGQHRSGVRRFSVKKLIEVFELDADGSRIASIRCFEDPDVADAFEESNSHYGQRTVYVLTNGTVVLLLEIESQLSMADEEAIAARLKQEALNGLKPAVRKLLGLNK